MVEHPHSIAAAFWYLSGPESQKLLAETRDSPVPGGIAHACELETSLYLAIHPELVQMDKAVREIPDWQSVHAWMDWNDGPLSIKGPWSGWTESGVMGDATAATREKGELWLEQAVKEIGTYIDDIAARAPRPGRDHHDGVMTRLPADTPTKGSRLMKLRSRLIALVTHRRDRRRRRLRWQHPGRRAGESA